MLGGIFMDLDLQLVEGPPPAGPPRTPGKWDILCVFIFLPQKLGVGGWGRSCRTSLACVWFWGSLQPYFGSRWNLWPSSWRL